MTATDDRTSMGASRKTYLAGSRDDLRVPMREVSLTNGNSLVLYDTSGPYTDASVATDVREGLQPLLEAVHAHVAKEQRAAPLPDLRFDDQQDDAA